MSGMFATGESDSRELRLLGPDHPVPGEVAYRRLELGNWSLEAVISQGNRSATEKPNEDALLVLLPAEPAVPALLAVADAHFGADAAELALAGAGSTYLRSTRGWRAAEGPRDLLLRCVRSAQAAVVEGGCESETTLLAALLCGEGLWWASVGDSYLYRFRNGRRPRVVNRRSRLWLGARLTVPVSEVTVLGRCPLEPGVGFLLATDGVSEPRQGWPALSGRGLQRVLNGAADRPLEALARFVLDAGGEDNLAAIRLSGPTPPPASRTGGLGQWLARWRGRG